MANGKMQYPWKRFWLERGGVMSFLDQGFLYDPDGEAGQHVNPGLAPLCIRPDKSCTILLGEPGMGKSSEMNLLISQVPPTDAVLSVNLRSFGDEGRFVSAVFGPRKVLEWKEGHETLHLFLDSLDECLLRIDTVAAIIADELEQLSPHKSRLRLYIACRTAPWPGFLETRILDLFGKDHVRLLEIAPLRREDVRIAAEQEGIADSEDFVRGVVNGGVVAFAMKPVTLRFLIGSWRLHGSFPTNLLDLYREGCRRLCEEDNPSRRASPRLHTDSNARFAIASRVAALTQIGNRFAIWTGRPSDDLPDEDVPLHELAGGDKQGIRVTEDAVRDTLDTGLFSARGSERIGWAHLTYAEFLAGYFCNAQHLPLSQLRTFFFHPSGTGLVPQLAEVAAWAALGNAKLLAEIAKEDPEALLNAGLEGITDLQKQSVVEGLLAQCRIGKYLHFNWSRAAVYSKLKYPRLIEQLRAELSRPDSTVQARYMAMSLGQACEEKGLCGYAVHIALDEAEDLGLRQLSVLTISDLGSIDERKALEPLLGRGTPKTQLKAYVLSALWPSVMKTEQVFALLPGWDGHLNTLSSFLHGRFRQGLRKDDLKPALHWAQQSNDTQGIHGSLVSEILRMAWEHIEDPEIGTLFADTVALKLGIYGWFATSAHGSDFQKLIDSDNSRRRILARALLSRLKSEDFASLHYPIRLADRRDALWLLEQFNSLNQAEQGVAVNFVRLALDIRNSEQMTALWYGCQSFPILAEHCGVFLQAVPLDAEWAKYERQSLERKQSPKEAVLNPPPAQRLSDALNRSEGGEVDAWLVIVQEMTLKENSTDYGDYNQASVLTMPGWMTSDEVTQRRIVDSSKRYLEFSTFFDLVWPAEGGVPLGAFAAVQALWICVQTDSAFIRNRPDLATKCAYSVVRFHASSKESTDVKQELLRQLAIFNESIIRSALVEEICRDNDRHGYYLARESVAAAWNSDLGRDLIALLRAGRFKPSVTAPLLAHLFELSPEPAREFASSTFFAPATSLLDDERVRAIGLAWIKGDPKSGWDIIWPLMKTDKDFGDYMVAQLGGSLHEQPRFLNVIEVTSLADFYIWMVSRYPYPGEGHEEGSGPRPVVYQHYLRDNALEHIKQRRSFASVAAIQRVMDELPQYTWLHFHLDQADLLARAGTWKPFTIEELRRVLADSSRRLVGSERDLLAVLRESLQRLQQQLRGETPTVRFLWNMIDPVLRPKGEEDLSDFMTAHFRSDIGTHGLVVNREVQIRRSNPDGVPGQRTDIHVSATLSVGSTARPVSVIIEVKGCWNPELLSAMKTQLRDRYLKENATRTGLYVVGWYAAPAWDTTDARKQDCGRLGLNELRATLEQQASELSEGVQLEAVVLDCSLE
jgi:hypothetical protein